MITLFMSVTEYVINQYLVFFMLLHERVAQTGAFTGVEELVGIQTYFTVFGGIAIGYTIMYQIHQSILDWYDLYKFRNKLHKAAKMNNDDSTPKT